MYKMKICLNPYLEGSGIGTYTLELARYLANHKEHEVIVIGDKKLENSRYNIKVYQNPKKRSFFFEVPPISWVYGPWQDYKISKLINQINPDVFHNSDHLAFNITRCPTIAVGWDYPKGLINCIRLAMQYEKKYLLPYRIIREIEMSIKDWFAHKKAKKVLCVTNHVKNNLGSKGIFLPPGIHQQPNDEKKFEKLTITFIGRNHIWTKRKGLRYLFDSLILIEKHYKIDYDLILIGKVPKNFNKILNKYNQIKHHVKIKNLLPREETLRIIKKSHLLAAPSLYDEFNFGVLEALSYGIPVIASKHNHSFQEMVGNDAGICVDIYNKKEFATELLKLIKNKEKIKILSENAIKKVKNNYSWESVGPKILQVYEECNTL